MRALGAGEQMDKLMKTQMRDNGRVLPDARYAYLVVVW